MMTKELLAGPSVNKHKALFLDSEDAVHSVAWKILLIPGYGFDTSRSKNSFLTTKIDRTAPFRDAIVHFFQLCIFKIRNR